VLGVVFAVVGAVYLARTGGAASRLLPRAPSRLGAPPRQARPRRVRLGSGALGRGLVYYRPPLPPPWVL